MGRAKKIIKIRVLKPKVKEIISVDSSDREARLEDEVSSDEFPSLSNEFASPLLRTSASAERQVQQIPETQQPVQKTVAEDEQRLFSQSTIYASPASRATQQRTAYRTQEQVIREFVPTIRETEMHFTPGSRRETFVNPELARMRGEMQERDYNKPVDLGEKEKRKREVWEV